MPTTACKSANEVPLGVMRTYVKSVDVGVFPQARRAIVMMLAITPVRSGQFRDLGAQCRDVVVIGGSTGARRSIVGCRKDRVEVAAFRAAFPADGLMLRVEVLVRSGQIEIFEDGAAEALSELQCCQEHLALNTRIVGCTQRSAEGKRHPQRTRRLDRLRELFEQRDRRRHARRVQPLVLSHPRCESTRGQVGTKSAISTPSSWSKAASCGALFPMMLSKLEIAAMKA